MLYLASFNRRLRSLRDEQRLSTEDVAGLCQVDEELVRCWECEDGSRRCFPNIDQLLMLCYRTQTPLERLLSLDDLGGGDQLELPGLSADDSDLGKAVDELQQALVSTLPDPDERKLLRRYRAATAENRRLILQLLS